MKKNYILDTNVLINDPQALFQFEDNNLYIPIYVLEELDKIKSEQSSRGKHSREVCRGLDSLRCQGSLSDGVCINNDGGVLTIYVPNEKKHLKVGLDINSVDNSILQCCLDIQEKDTSIKTILVTMDVNLRVRAESIGIQTASYENQSIDFSKMITGMVEYRVADGIIDEYYTNKKLDVDDDTSFYYNAYVTIVEEGSGKTALGKYCKDKKHIRHLNIPQEGVMGIKPRNKEQKFVIDMLLDDDIKIVSLVGAPGCGKTILSSAVGLSKTLAGKYNKFTIARPIVVLGNDVGYLPGPQPLDAKILTPNGWTTMGQLKIGDYVSAKDGKPTKVIGVFPQGKKAVYKLTTTEKSSTECCEDHLWLTVTSNDRINKNGIGTVKSTKEIASSLFTKNGKTNHHLPRNEAVEFYQTETLPIPPYTFGALLGDGCFGKRNLSFSGKDEDILNKINTELSLLGCCLVKTKSKEIDYELKNSNFSTTRYCKNVVLTNENSKEELVFNSLQEASNKLGENLYTIKQRCYKQRTIDGYKYKFTDNDERWPNHVKEQLYRLDLLGKRAWEKHIPDIYKYSSIENRVEILKGLMDTDGTVGKTGSAAFSTTSKQLALDVIEIVKSLGGRAVISERNRIGNKSTFNNIITRRISYEFIVSLPEKYNPFFTTRKASRFSCKNIHGIGIESIEYVGEKEVQCIKVEDQEHLYITDDFIVTHNTISEKLDPYMQPIYDNLDLLLMNNGKKVNNKGINYEDLIKQGIIKIEPLTYIRGRSLHNQFVLIDESQNLNLHEIVTIITRCGEGTKIILDGDPSQIDTPYLDKCTCGLSIMVEKMHDHPLVGHITLSKGERSELANLATERFEK
jgi:predicted ribonuclease YlaK